MDTRTAPNNPDQELEIVRERIAFTRAIVDWCLRQAHRSMERQRVEAALGWNALAARALSWGCDPLVSEILERNLLEIARQIPAVKWLRPSGPDAPRRCLHVIDGALPYGGHTAMARRWITADPENSVHSVALPNQQQPVPDTLADAVRQSGGEIFLPDANPALLSRAAWLRKLAYEKADCVVLHIANDNVIAPVAFGVDGGPPILAVNHAAHKFWVGPACIDITLNCRGSRYERFWTEHYRGISRSATLPIPVPPPVESAPGQVFTDDFRADARRQLNLPADAVVILSVGDGKKYAPMAGLNFFEVCRSILSASPSAWMVVAGPAAKGQWQELHDGLGGRFTAVGRQFDLRAYYAAADLYIEGFPFGSTTALLESGIHGLPCVLAPGECAPPFGTDGVALDDILVRPSGVEAYAQRVVELIQNRQERIRCGETLARSIASHHSSEGWTKYLSALMSGVPTVHSVHPAAQPPSPPEQFNEYWVRYTSRFEPNPLVCILDSAIASGLTPRIDLPLWRAYRQASRVCRRDGRLNVAAPVALGLLLPFCPEALRTGVYQGVKSICAGNGAIARFAGAMRSSRATVPIAAPEQSSGEAVTAATYNLQVPGETRRKSAA